MNFPRAKRKEEQIAQKLDFVFDKTHGGNTTALVVGGISGQFALFVEDVSGGREKRVRACDIRKRRGGGARGMLIVAIR